MEDRCDVIVIGGGIVGCATAYFLSSNPDFSGSVVVLEPDPAYTYSSSTLSASSIRTQFSNGLNIKISQYGYEVLTSFHDLMSVGNDRPDLKFHAGGYLFLAETDAQVEIMKQNYSVQLANDADVVLWSPSELASSFPHLNVADIKLASYGRSGEGWFDNVDFLNGFKRKAESLGVRFIKDEAIGFNAEKQSLKSVKLKSGKKIEADYFVNAAGSRAGKIAKYAGINVPVVPRKRTVFVFDCEQSPQGSAAVNMGLLPLMVDSTGVYCRPEGNVFISGCTPKEDLDVDFNDFTPNYTEFDDIIWPALANRSSYFEAIKVRNYWAGHYAYNVLDQNMILGCHPEIENLYFANGFSGHGLQQAPATGRGLSELIIYRGFRSLDLSPFSWDRVIKGQPFLERSIV